MLANNFNSRVVSKITGITQRQLQYWDDQNLVKPSIRSASGKGTVRLYSFTDLVQLQVLKKLRDNGISLQKIKKCVHYLNKNFLEIEKPLAQLSFVTDGETIFVICENKDVLLDTLGKGQLVMYIALGNIAEELKEEAKIYTAIQRERIVVNSKYFNIEIEPDTEDGGFAVQCVDIKGCVTQGETKAEALENIKEAIELCMIARIDVGVKQCSN